MKKIILSTLLFFLGFNISFAQEKLVDLLKSLSVKSKVINTKQFTESNNYFESMQNKKNFHIKEHDLIAYYINSYENFSIYQLAWTGSYTEEMYKEDHKNDIDEFDSKFAFLLFDNKKKRCYMIKYGGSSPGEKYFRVESIDRYNKISIDPDFDIGVSAILRLDENFLPLYGTIIGPYAYMIENHRRGDDEFVALFEFKQCNDTIYQILLKIPPISINEVTTVEFFKLLSDEHGYTEYIYPDWDEYDIERIFGLGTMF